MELGIKGLAELLTTHEHSASSAGSGALEVFSTPSMIALMEKAALDSVQPYLEEGHSTVGTRVEVSHLAASPIGMTVRAESELIEIDRKRLVFKVEAYAGDKLIGEGLHTRFIINAAKFMAKTEAK